MKHLREEVEANFVEFSKSWKKRLSEVSTSLDAQTPKYLDSYSRLVSLQAWRSELLEKIVDKRAMGFYLEAQNDAVVSHVFARMGAWRSALKSLRSCIENVMQCLYYKDHPVELELWHRGEHFLQRVSLTTYLASHPQIKTLTSELTGLNVLGAEYSTLNNAVHGSSLSFRMTLKGEDIQLFSSEVASLGQWGTRERSVLLGINLLLLCMFRENVSGAALLNLRKAISLVIPNAKHVEIKSKLGITLFA